MGPQNWPQEFSYVETPDYIHLSDDACMRWFLFMTCSLTQIYVSSSISFRYTLLWVKNIVAYKRLLSCCMQYHLTMVHIKSTMYHNYCENISYTTFSSWVFLGAFMTFGPYKRHYLIIQPQYTAVCADLGTDTLSEKVWYIYIRSDKICT